MSNYPGIALNEDDSHFYFTRANKELNEDIVASFVDQYAGTQVTDLILNPNCMRTSYASKVWDPIWLGYDPEGPDDQPLLKSTAPESRKGCRNWIHTAWKLDQMGIDPYTLWIERARKHGIKPWISMRMNDVHNVDDEKSFIHSEFWRNNPNYRRIPYEFKAWQDRAFDYGHEEVRKHHLALVKELAERYDFDGLELDWMRFGYHFRPGFEDEGRMLLNDFTREVRSILDSTEKRVGHKVLLSARVPSRPQTAYDLGMDAVGWAIDNLVDALVITPFWATTETDMPVETWKYLLRGTNTQLWTGLEILVRPYPQFAENLLNTIVTTRGTAKSFIDRGSDRIYLFNYMDSETAQSDLQNYSKMLQEIGSGQTIGLPRRHIITYPDTYAPGEAESCVLPQKLSSDARCFFRIHIGNRPEAFSGANVVIGLIEGTNSMEIRCNGNVCEPLGEADICSPSPAFPAYAFKINDNYLKNGYNVISVTSHSEINIGWIEIKIH